MAIFNSFGRKASEVAAKTMQKTQELAEISRLNSLISEEEKKINNNYFQLGKLYIAMHSADGEAEFAGMVQAVTDAEKKIAEYKENIQVIQGIQRCANCGAAVPRGVAFCSACGSPLPKTETTIPDDCVRCEKCGATVKKSMRFCTSCGNPMRHPAMSVKASESLKEKKNADTVCVNCGATVKNGMRFCTECGSPVEQSKESVEAAEMPEATEKVCPNCGAHLAEDVVFCTECGTKLE